VLDLEVVAWVGAGVALVVLIGALLFFALRDSDPARAIASLEVLANTPFALSFAAKQGEYRVWLRFDIAHGGDEDAYGLTAALDVTGAGPPVSIEERIGEQGARPRWCRLGQQRPSSRRLHAGLHGLHENRLRVHRDDRRTASRRERGRARQGRPGEWVHREEPPRLRRAQVTASTRSAC
jgi:hypothetical protein